MRLEKSLFHNIFILLLFCNPTSIFTQNILDGIEISNRWLTGDEVFFQDYIPEVIPEYFLLGTLHINKMGRFSDGLKEDQFDYYDSYYSYDQSSEEHLVSFIENYIQCYFNLDIRIQKTDNRINLYSKEMAKKINSYFDENGLLHKDMFNTKEKIYSFLLGCYFRRGYQLDPYVYSIKMHYNDLIYFLLKEAGCSNIVFLSTKNRIPANILFYFEPSVLLRKYFETLENGTLISCNSNMHEVDSLNVMDKKVYKRYDIEEKIIEIVNDFRE